LVVFQELILKVVDFFVELVQLLLILVGLTLRLLHVALAARDEYVDALHHWVLLRVHLDVLLLVWRDRLPVELFLELPHLHRQLFVLPLYSL